MNERFNSDPGQEQAETTGTGFGLEYINEMVANGSIELSDEELDELAG